MISRVFEWVYTLFQTINAGFLLFNIWAKSFLSTRTLSEEKHLLLLAWAFPPDVSGGVYRPLSIVKYCLNTDWEITVFAGPNPQNITNAGICLAESIDLSCVHRCEKITKLKPSYSLFPRVDGGFLDALNLFEKVLHIFGNKNPRVIVSTGPPFHTFVTGLFLSKYFRCDLILDFRDEWSVSPFSFVQKGNSDSFWEKRCVYAAKYVVFTTDSQRDNYLKLYPDVNPSKFHVISNGWDENVFIESSLFDFKKNIGKKYLSFVGSLGGHCLPGNFLKCLEVVFDLKRAYLDECFLVFVGSKSDEAKAQISNFKYKDNIICIDHVDQKSAVSIMKSSDALLIFYDINLSRYIPGKFYDYASTRNPIIVYGVDGEVPRLVGEIKCGLFVNENDVNGLSEAFKRIVENKLPCDFDLIENFLEKTTRKKMAQTFLQLFEACIDEKPNEN